MMMENIIFFVLIFVIIVVLVFLFVKTQSISAKLDLKRMKNNTADIERLNKLVEEIEGQDLQTQIENLQKLENEFEIRNKKMLDEINKAQENLNSNRKLFKEDSELIQGQIKELNEKLEKRNKDIEKTRNIMEEEKNNLISKIDKAVREQDNNIKQTAKNLKETLQKSGTRIPVLITSNATNPMKAFGKDIKSFKKIQTFTEIERAIINNPNSNFDQTEFWKSFYQGVEDINYSIYFYYGSDPRPTTTSSWYSYLSGIFYNNPYEISAASPETIKLEKITLRPNDKIITSDNRNVTVAEYILTRYPIDNNKAITKTSRVIYGPNDEGNMIYKFSRIN